jgi:hypothetical protein
MGTPEFAVADGLFVVTNEWLRKRCASCMGFVHESEITFPHTQA